MEQFNRRNTPDRRSFPLPVTVECRRQQSRRREDLQLRQRDRELQAAYRISVALSQHIDVSELVVRALQTAIEVVNAESGSVLLADPDTNTLVFRHVVGDKATLLIGKSIPWDQGLAGSVFISGEPQVTSDVKHDNRHSVLIDAETGYHTHDMITLPLKRWEGKSIGVLQVLNKRDGQLDGYDLSILTIISALAAAALEQARLYEDAKLAEVVHRLGDISHDLKNLLMPVSSGAEFLKGEISDLVRELPSDLRTNLKIEARRAQCEDIIAMQQDSARRIHDRVREIADCVKGLSAPPAFAPCRLGEVAGAAIKTLGLVAKERSISLRAENLESLPPILADERRIFNALYNLINNAIPEVPCGGSIAVSGALDPASETVTMTVTDTGRGMPPEVRESLFTVRTISRKAGGTGLGTKIVKDVVDAHGGRITVESKEGMGTSFLIRLPLRPPGAA